MADKKLFVYGAGGVSEVSLDLGAFNSAFSAYLNAPSSKKAAWKKLKKAKPLVICLSLDFYPVTNDTPPAYRPPRPRNNGGTE